MTYALAQPLQAAVYAALSADAALAALVGTAIYDAVPAGTLPPIYVTLGQETVRDRSDQTGAGAEHEFNISIVTDSAGFLSAKSAAAIISDLLVDADLSLNRGRLVSLGFHRAKAVRSTGGDQRRIDLIFRARVEDA